MKKFLGQTGIIALLLCFIVTESIYMVILGMSIVFDYVAKPFEAMGEWIINLSNKINTK
jgi:hypothetical protein